MSNRSVIIIINYDGSDIILDIDAELRKYDFARFNDGCFISYTADITQAYTAIIKGLGKYKKSIFNVYVIDGNCSSDAVNLIEDIKE